MALEVESCSAAWREARRKKDWPVRVDRRIREREGGELARSVVSEQRGTSGSYLCHPEVHDLARRSSWSTWQWQWVQRRRNCSFRSHVRPAKLKIVRCASWYLFLTVCLDAAVLPLIAPCRLLVLLFDVNKNVTRKSGKGTTGYRTYNLINTRTFCSYCSSVFDRNVLRTSSREFDEFRVNMNSSLQAALLVLLFQLCLLLCTLSSKRYPREMLL